MPIINLTDLTIRLANAEGEVYKTFEPDENSITIHTRGEEIEVDDVFVDITHVTSIEGLPAPEDGTYYIAPRPVAQVVNRPDLLIADTGPSAIRSDDGTVYAVRRLYSVAGDAA